MSIYRRGPNWYIDFTFKGQRIRESIGPSRKGAEKVIAKKKAEIAENKFLDVRKDPDPIAFHEFAKDYLKWSKANKKPSTYVRDLSIMRIFDRSEEFGLKNIQDVTAWLIERYKARRKEKVKPATVNRELALLKHFYSKAVEWGKIKENPATKKVKFLKGAVKRVRFLMPEEVMVLLSNCSNTLKPIVTVAVHTGMRRGEILGLKWDQVNLDRRIISILDSKNHERRDIPMDGTVWKLLDEMPKTGEYVFSSKKGLALNGSFIHIQFHADLKKSEINDFRFHDLRHTFASNLVMAGEDLNTVAELLGHKGLEMTRRYAHLSPKFKKNAVDVLDRILSQNPPQTETSEKVVNLRF